MARRGLRVVRLPKAKVDDDTQFVATLVHLLGMARSGKCKGYAMVYVIEDDVSEKSVEAACVPDDAHESGNALRLLGGMRRMEVNFMDRVFGAPNSERGVDDA